METFEKDIRGVVGDALTYDDIRELLPIAYGELEFAVTPHCSKA